MKVSVCVRTPIMTLKDFVAGGDVILQSTLMLRKRCLPALPDWICQVKFVDLTLQFLCLQQGKLAYLREVTMLYRQHQEAQFSQLPAAEKIKWDIITWKEIRKRIEPSYHHLIDRRLAGAYYRLSELYKMSSRAKESKAALDRAVEIGSALDHLRHLIRAFVPCLYRELLVLKVKALFRQH